MAQRKIDLIRGLENQLEHEKRRAKLAEDKLAELRRGADEFLMTFNAILMEATLKFGERQQEDGKLLGYRLAVPKVDVEKMNAEYDVRVELQDGNFVIGMIPREGEKDG